MKLSRRDFMKYCSASAAALGLSCGELEQLESIAGERVGGLANGASGLWLQGAACTGCGVSLLNRISADEPTDAADLLIAHIDLEYHPNLSAAAGETIADLAERLRARGSYVLAVEGSVPTAFGGQTCWAWSRPGPGGEMIDVTLQQAVRDLAQNASQVLAVGTCASWGGVAALPPNPTGVQSLSAATGRTTINIAGCPPHPDWIVQVIVQLLLGKTIVLDSLGRPRDLYGNRVHEHCPRRGTSPAKAPGADGRCLKSLGCQGPQAAAECPRQRWNNGSNWCVDANAPCRSCTSPNFLSRN